MIEMLNVVGEKWEGLKLIVEVWERPMVEFPEMKMKSIVSSYFGNNISFGDDDDYDEASMAYFAMKDFYKWYMEQTQLVKEQNEA